MLKLDDESLKARTRHVITETARVRAATRAIESESWAQLGTILTASHASLRDDFEVTCAELDVAAEAALEAGALGARASGGAVIAVVSRDRVAAVRELVEQRFDGAGWPRPGVVDAQATAWHDVSRGSRAFGLVERHPQASERCHTQRMIRTPRGVLLVVALVIALMLAACGEQKSAQEPDESASPSPTAAAKPADLVIDLADLEKGAAPKIGWRQDLTLHDADRTVRLAGNELADVAVLGERIITRGPGQSGDTEVQVRDSKGTITDRYPNPLSRLVTNSERTIVAWIAEDNTPKVLQAGHRDALDLPRVSKKKGDQGDAVAVLGNDCFHGPEEVEGAGCSVFFTLTSKDKRAPFVASNHGFVQEADTTITDLLDVSDDQALIGIVDPSAAKLCSRYESEATSYDTCDHVLRRVLAGRQEHPRLLVRDHRRTRPRRDQRARRRHRQDSPHAPAARPARQRSGRRPGRTTSTRAGDREPGRDDLGDRPHRRGREG